MATANDVMADGDSARCKVPCNMITGNHKQAKHVTHLLSSLKPYSWYNEYGVPASISKDKDRDRYVDSEDAAVPDRR